MLCVGDCVIGEPQVFLDHTRPVRVADPRVARAGDAALGRVRRHPARRAISRRTRATPRCQSKPRVFGVVHYDDSAGTFGRSVREFEQQLRAYKVKPAVTVGYSLDLNTAQKSVPHVDRAS